MRTLSFLAGAALVATCASAQTLQFADRTKQAGLHCDPGLYNGMTGAVAAGDFNNDGWQDLFVAGDSLIPNRLFINDGDGTFTDRAAEWGIAEALFTFGVAVGDYNADGRQDIFLTTGGSRAETSRPIPGRHVLYRNNGGTFTDVAEELGVATTAINDYNGWGAGWGDWDLDGDLDLFVTGWVHDHQPANCFFRNDGDAGFTNVNDIACIDASGKPFDVNDPVTRGFSPIFADMNGDRYPELLLVSDFLTSRYLINNGDGTFTEATQASGAGLDGNGMGSMVADIDNDLHLDWYATSIYGSEGPSIPGDGNKLYVNRGDGTFDEIAKDAGIDDGGWGWGAVGIDFDHDGWVDIAETNGWDQFIEFRFEQAYLWLNNATPDAPSFREVALDVGLEHFDFGRGMVAFDPDNDGDQDLVISSTYAQVAYFENQLQGPDAHWLRVFVETPGRALAPNGYGVRIVATTPSGSQVRHITGGSNFLSQSEISAHFGFGAETVADLLIEWPNGRRTLLEGVGADRTLTVRYCPADFAGGGDRTGDGTLDPGDFQAFLALFASGDGFADLTGSADERLDEYGRPDGLLDAEDFFYFLDSYASGCN